MPVVVVHLADTRNKKFTLSINGTCINNGYANTFLVALQTDLIYSDIVYHSLKVAKLLIVTSLSSVPTCIIRNGNQVNRIPRN